MEEEKKLYDARGRMSNLTRLLPFDREAFYHLLSYRTLIVVSIFTFIFFILSLAFSPLNGVWKALLVLVWLLLTSQVYESAKAFALVGSGGRAFGHLNESFMSSMMKTEDKGKNYKLIPYAVVVVWLIGLIVFAAEML